MRFGVIGDSSLATTCQTLGHAARLLADSHAIARTESVAARVNAGVRLLRALDGECVDALLDRGGEGLLFLATAGEVDEDQVVEFNQEYRNPLEIRLLHHELAAPLVSVFSGGIPLTPPGATTSDAGFDLNMLRLETWVKLVGDRLQCAELQSFGVPQVHYLPPGAPDLDYATAPLQPDRMHGVLGIVADCPPLSRGAALTGPELLAATLGLAQHGGQAGFLDAHCGLYGLGAAPSAGDSRESLDAKWAAYVPARRAFLQALRFWRRERFVLLLRRQLGEALQLSGSGWREALGIPSAPAPTGAAQRAALYRDRVINIVLPDAECESGLSRQVFEVTAAGGFALAWHSPELAAHFEIGRECDTFRDEGELLAKCRHYLSRREQVVEIARAGQARALREHLESRRLQAVLANMRIERRGPALTGRRYFNLGNWIDDCRGLLPDPEVILDCGAFTGTTARLLREAFPSAEIFSFEPVASIFEQLRQTARELRVHAVQAAVADVDGTTTIHVTVGGQSASLLGFQAERNPLILYHKPVGAEQVRVYTLDTWLRENGIAPQRVDILKMDVQGAELRALTGAPELLRHVRAVFLEVGFKPVYRDMPLFDDVEAFMAQAGFVRHALYPSAAPHLWGDALYVRSERDARRPASTGDPRPGASQTSPAWAVAV